VPDDLPPTVRLGATEVHPLTMDEAVGAVMDLAAKAEPALVVTPNVDHLVMLERDARFADAYRRASLRLADGAPLVLLARVLHTPIPERVAGSDLIFRVLAAAEAQERSVFLFGGQPETSSRAVDVLRRSFPTLRIAGTATPMVDIDTPGDDEAEALAQVRRTRPDILIMFLGTPKQEVWFWARQPLLPPVVALALGGTIDMVAGTKRRAPRWLQRIGLEWTWRLAQDPVRLGRRYLIDDVAFVGIATRQLRARRRARPHAAQR
jgi:N-acetylglucosaminyldiphosphoundecaprenol N-acetyl-beta-D-mannosaminyltransferase